MRIKKAHKEKHNTKIAILFVLFVFGVILIAILFKAVQLVGQSKFDGTNRFTVSISSNKNLEVVSFSPYNKTITILEIEDAKKDLKVGKFLKIPIDGFIEGSPVNTNKDIEVLMSSIFFNYNNIKTNLTIIDILRLFLASKTNHTNNISINSISLSTEDRAVDKLLEKLFKNEVIEKENQTVEIINTTDATGLGGRLARLITNMGGNVIQVSTENNSQKNSVILYKGEKTYTVEKLSKVLGFKIGEMSRQSIADITIIVGEDNKNPLSF